MKSMGHSNHSWPSTPAVSPHTTSILLAYNSEKNENQNYISISNQYAWRELTVKLMP
jgi:hypothetical protein